MKKLGGGKNPKMKKWGEKNNDHKLKHKLNPDNHFFPLFHFRIFFTNFFMKYCTNIEQIVSFK